VGLWIQAGPSQAASHAEVADLMVRITGLRSRLPWPAVAADKIRVLSGYGYVPLGGWQSREEMPGWQIALLVVRASQGKRELPSPFRNNLAQGKLVVVDGVDTDEGRLLTDGNPQTGLRLPGSGWIYVDLGSDVIVDLVSNLLGTTPGVEQIYVLRAGANPMEFPGEWVEIEPPRELQGIASTGSLFSPARCRFVRWSWVLQEGAAQQDLWVNELMVCNYVDQLTQDLYLVNVVQTEVESRAMTVLDSFAEFHETVPFVPETPPPPPPPPPSGPSYPPHPPFEPPPHHPGEIPGMPGQRPEMPR